MSKAKIKVCGMTNVHNVVEVCKLFPDYIGFIFYSKSARYVGEDPDLDLFKSVPDPIKKVAVFVNESYEKMNEITRRYNIDHVQLHGMESPELVRRLRLSGKTVIKALPGDQLVNKNLIKGYSKTTDFLLFDAAVASYGGSGKKFDWSKLGQLDTKVLFFLSGGIAPGDASAVMAIHDKNLFAVDINSRFETKPGIKNVELVKSFINRIRNGA